MWQVKLIVVGMLIMSVGSAMAWNEESGYAEGEYVDISWSDWAYAWLSSKDRESPAWYNPLKQFVLSIGMFFISDHEDNYIDITINTTVEKWDGDSYEPDGTSWESGTTSEAFANNTVLREMSWDPAGEYFRNNTEALENFTTRDADPDHPDILNVSITIEGGGVDIEDHGYITLDDDDLEDIGDEINNPDYGFALGGRGAGGSSGSIYEGINLYGSGYSDESGMGKGFGSIFFVLIPLIFILAAMKLSYRFMK